ncbi:MAG: ABC transporter ATP-binding protein [Pseudomonadales bacterium]|nr:ABC transporter ATP-binding protein [Pseudomonadales bacterium]
MLQQTKIANAITVETRDLRLDYGELTAVSNVNLQITAGEIYGLVGPNGAGKSSLLKMLANLNRPTYGEIFINGIDLAEDPWSIHRDVGYMPDLSPVAPELKVWEFLEFFAAAYDIPAHERKARVEECLEQVKMAEHREAYGKGLSRGMMQRVVLAKTLIPRPKILLLDEPASGMDPIARINLKNILVDLSHQGVTTIVSSHILTELGDMCTSLGIMHKGELVKTGNKASLLVEHPVHTRSLTALLEDFTIDGGRVITVLEANEHVSEIVHEGGAFVISFSGDEIAEAELLRELIEAGVKVTSFSRETASMEDVLVKLVAPEQQAESAAEGEDHD